MLTRLILSQILKILYLDHLAWLLRHLGAEVARQLRATSPFETETPKAGSAICAIGTENQIAIDSAKGMPIR
jgi:hypothetical protein